jgi:alanine racemase
VDHHHLVWAEVDLNAIAHNVRELRRITHPEARLLLAVKANGYGHGAVEVARQGLAAGADALGVARSHEGIELREAGIQAPILVFGYTPPQQAPTLIEYDMDQSVYHLQTARAYSKAGVAAGKPVRLHVKIDTGMGRLGLLADAFRTPRSGFDRGAQSVDEIKEMAGLEGVELEGVFTHFASSDSADKDYTRQQMNRFGQFLEDIEKAGVTVNTRHAANSGAIIDLPETHLDMVRAGISLYGLYPSNEVDRSRIALRPAMALKARIIHLKQVPAGFKVSYGMTYETPGPTVIATVPVGYADGFSRLLSNRGEMLVHGQRAPIVGRVCMDLTMLDVGHIPDVCLEDEVVIFGRQGAAEISADELAAELNTINYEVTSSLTTRVPRVYVS